MNDNIQHNDKNQIRINKFISEKGICSRREADKLIADGKVTINGEVALTGSKVYPKDEVKLNGKIISKRPKLV